MTGPMLKNLSMLRHLTGEEDMPHLVLATSKWDLVDTNNMSRAEDREIELMTSAQSWAPLLAAGATMIRNCDSCDYNNANGSGAGSPLSSIVRFHHTKMGRAEERSCHS